MHSQMIRLKIRALLSLMQSEMSSAGLWGSELPSQQAMSSQAPFACDTMPFEQWLQFIFIPKIQFLLDNDHDLPSHVSIRPMAEEMFRDKSGVSQLNNIIGQIDRLLSGSAM